MERFRSEGVDVSQDRLLGGCTERNDPLFAPLSHDLDVVVSNEGIVLSQGTELAGSDTGVQKKEDCGVKPGPEETAWVDRVDDVIDFPI